ncbi:hypothetical protein ElyMa_002109300 [Elysia marginata]|uniref:Uncharacterized protein n=1 Tax=Elysia marginata TaxID=1093978 RepID=A0AAV4FHA2_9GAST|nr:hypothetical protein ElyMa_002109300 [Elysia marginata]
MTTRPKQVCKTDLAVVDPSLRHLLSIRYSTPERQLRIGKKSFSGLNADLARQGSNLAPPRPRADCLPPEHDTT